MKKKYNQTYFKSIDINELNTELPVKLKNLQCVIDAVAHRYPAISKSEISLISKIFMEEIRKQLIEGNSINIQEFLFNMKLYTFCKLNKNKVIFNAKVQVSTPNKMRNKC